MNVGDSMKTDKLFDVTYSLIIGLGLIFLSIITLIGRKWLYINLVNVFILALFFLSLKEIISYFNGKKDKNINFTRSVINILFCIVFSLFKNIPLSLLPIIFGFYLVLNACVKYINFIILFENKSNGKLTEFVAATFYLIVGISSIFAPLKYLEVVLIALGIYLLLLGINFIKDFISGVLPTSVKNKIIRRIRITLPAIVEAIIPYTVLNEINYLLDKENMDKEFIYEEKKNDIEPDIEVLVHISNRGFNRLGHCDIVYNNKVISYGAYDKKTTKFHALISDGVVFVADRKEYIPFCIEHSKKTIFAFGIKLTDNQKKNVEKEIDNLFTNLVEWDCPYKVAESENKNKKPNKKKYDDYASCLYRATLAKMYKFNKGKYKKYFVLGNNCVKLADEIIGKSGTDILKMSGIITPGAYYEYLNREFKKKNSMVISRKIYNNKNIDSKTLKKIMKGL